MLEFLKSSFGYTSEKKGKMKDFMEVIRENIDELRKEIDEQDSFIKTVAARLQAYIGVQKTGNSPIDLVKKLLYVLEQKENPLKPIVDSLRRMQTNSLQYIEEIEKETARVVNSDPIETTDLGIEQRLSRIVSLLKTFQD